MSVEIYEEARDRLFESLGGSLIEMLEVYEYKIYCEDGYDEHDAYEHMRRGGCMLCGEPLGEDTLILVDEQGILGLWCSTTCLSDMHIIPWLEEMLTAKIARIDPNNKEEEGET